MAMTHALRGVLGHESQVIGPLSIAQDRDCTPVALGAITQQQCTKIEWLRGACRQIAREK